MARLGAVVLAAGASRRFEGGNKLLADIGGEALLARVIRALGSGGVMDIVVVTGCDRTEIERALGAWPVRLTHNADWPSGMGSSIATGVGALEADCDGAFIVPADMPFLGAEVVAALVARYTREEGARIIVPTTAEGGQRNPVLWPRRFFADLADLRGPLGAKALLARFSLLTTTVAFPDAALFADIDTRDDLARARSR